tara:strand:+ start:363 stop:587 length:225 start_codon:yes stop_codon:yes gene_type:complete
MKTKKITMSKEIFRIEFSVTDYGTRYEPKPIETHTKDWKTVVKKHLKKNAHAMDLSKEYTFKIISVKSAGFGTI